MKVGFYSNDIQFDPDALTTKGLGGSESALLNLTREWKNSYPEDEIIIYNNNSGEYKKYNNIIIKPITYFYSEIRTADLDVLISLRDPSTFLSFVDSKLKILWSQDICNESRLINLQKNKYAIESIDLILANSQFSYDNLKNGFPNSNIQILKNGYNQNLINECEKEDIAIYCSTPFRGLSYLLELWPEIYKGCQKYNINPKLEIYGGMDLYNQSNEYFKNLYNDLSKMINTTVFGSISQEELYKKMCKSKVMLYPNTWLETSCMVILEAISCGVWIITSDYGALNEQVKDNETGNLIKYDQNSVEYKKEFINYAIQAFMQNFISNRKYINSWKNQSTLLRNMILEKLNDRSI